MAENKTYSPSSDVLKRWLKADRWTVGEALALLEDRDPDAYPLKHVFVEDHPIGKHVLRSIGQGTLKLKKQAQSPFFYEIAPYDFLHWAITHDFPLPQALQDALTESDNPQMAALYAGPGHHGNEVRINLNDPSLSVELKAAILVYGALYGPDGQLNKKQGHLSQIQKFLEAHYTGLSKTAVDRIAQVVNPNKKGGLKKTE